MKEEKVYEYINQGCSVNLHSFYRYTSASASQKDEVCNGAGPRRFGSLVPDTFWGLCIAEPANNHDWDYQWGENIEDKRSADRTFKNNMLRCAEALRLSEASKKPNWLINKYNQYKHYNRINMIEDYYKAVDVFGGPSFFDKTKISFNWAELAV